MSAIGNALEQILRGSQPKDNILNRKEARLIALQKHLEELRIEKALLDTSDEDVTTYTDDTALALAEKEAAGARASYALQQQIAKNVLMVDPVLKAVHGATEATPIERHLVEMINQRDAMAMLHNYVLEQIAAIQQILTKAEQENELIDISNRTLADEMVNLARQTRHPQGADIQDLSLKAKYAELEKSIADLKKRRRFLKGVTSNMVAESGVDWANDDALLDLVIDEDG